MMSLRRAARMLVILMGLGVPACAPPEEGATESVGKPLIVPGSQVINFAHLGGATFNNEKYLTFIGGGNLVNVVRTEGGSWTAPRQIPNEVSNQGASLCVYQGSLHIGFFDERAQRFITYRSADGAAWEDKQAVNVTDPGQRGFATAALVVYGNRLNAFVPLGPIGASIEEWRRFGAIRQLLLESDGSWRTADVMSGVQPVGVSAAVLGNELVMAWNRPSSGSHFRTFRPGGGWGPIVDHGRGQGHLFSGVSDPETLLWVQRDTAPNHLNWISIEKTNGASFQAFKETSHASGRPPLGVFFSQFDNKIEFAHVGTDSQASLNFTEIPFTQ